MTEGARRHFAPTSRPRSAAMVAMMTLCGLWPAAAEPAQNLSAGKPFTVVVGAAAGGGYDLLARLMARHLGKHIPGNPTVIVQNMPAAGSLAAANYIFNAAPKDGSVIALIQRGMLLAKLTNPSGVRFELDKLNWIGSLNSEVGISFAWHTAPHRITKDLFERELIVGGMTGVDPEMTPRLYNSLIDTKFKIITGYNGTTEIGLAMERGEVQGIGDWSWSSLKKQRPDWIRDKQITLLLQGALHKDPELPNLPSALDFIKNDADRKIMELYFTQKTAARPLIAPPGIPADRLATLRTAFIALAADQEFLADAEKSSLDVAPISGEAVAKVIALIAATPPDIATRFTAATAPPAQSR